MALLTNSEQNHGWVGPLWVGDMGIFVLEMLPPLKLCCRQDAFPDKACQSGCKNHPVHQDLQRKDAMRLRPPH